MTQKRIVVAGHISLDITPAFKNSGRQKLTDLLKPGKLLHVGAAHVCAGGAVSNTGLGLHKLGARVCLMAKAGDDSFGRMLKEQMTAAGCDLSMELIPGEATSYTIVIAPKGMDRFFLHNPGCNHSFGWQDVDYGRVGEADHFHFGYPTLMKQFYQNDGEQLVTMFRKVKELGVTTSLDLTAVDPESEAAQCDWKKILAAVLPYVDFFVPSIEELCWMLDRERYLRWQEAAGEEDVVTVISVKDDVRFLANQVLKLGARAVLLKCGVAGMYLMTMPEPELSGALPDLKGWGGIDHFEQSYVPDRVLSATGAGDTSIAAFLKAMLDGYPPLSCMQLATATGAACVTAYDAISGLLPFEELKARIAAGWEKQII